MLHVNHLPKKQQKNKEKSKKKKGNGNMVLNMLVATIDQLMQEKTHMAQNAAINDGACAAFMHYIPSTSASASPKRSSFQQ